MIMSRSSGRRGASRSHNLVWGRTLSGKVGSWAIRSELSCFRTNWKTGCSLLPSHPRQKKGQTCPRSPKEWRPEAGPAAPCPARSPTASVPSPFQARSWEAEVGEEAASCPGASGRAEREGRHHPHPRRGHTWVLQAGMGAQAGAWLQRVWAASPWGPPDGPAARPPSYAGRKQPPGLPGRRARVAGRGPRWPRPRGEVPGRPRLCEPGNPGSASCCVSLGKSVSLSVPQFPQ